MFSQGKLFPAFFAAICSAGLTLTAYANPALQNVEAGAATISQTTNTTVVNQTSDKAIINWQSFNIAAGEKTQFVQPTSSAVALNRINPVNGASQIYGSLSANGTVILVNGAGIHFGPNASVDVGSIIATTAGISNANFLNGNYVFDSPSSYHGTIFNAGSIIAAKNGLVALVGNNVRNDGYIRANLGTIALGAGKTFTLSFSDDGLVNFVVTSSAKHAHVTNNGTLMANGGSILVSANTASHTLDNTINMRGVAVANSVKNRNGVIILSSNGAISVTGKLLTRGRHHSQHGGTIKILGDTIHLSHTAIVDASGRAGGGSISIGGDAHGVGPDTNATSTQIDAGVLINASATHAGNGGNIVVWSNDDTEVHGNLIATGGNLSGNGGTVETSGGYLNVAGVSVDLTAKQGSLGTWLLDPTDLMITNNGGSNQYVYQYSNNSYVGDDSKAVSYVDISQLIAALNSSNVTLQTTGTGAGSGSGDITVAADIASTAWTAATTLKLSAYHDININATIANTHGGSLILQADNSGTGVGTVNVGASGLVAMSGGGAVSVYYNPSVFGTQDAAIADSSNLPNSTYFQLSGGTTFTPFMLINNLTALENIQTNLAGNYALNTSIDASSTNPSGFPYLGAFSGVFDGMGHTINNLYIYTAHGVSGGLGLFASVTGTIENLGLMNFDIEANGTFGVGGITGYLDGTILNSYATGVIRNAVYTGGLVGDLGQNNANATIQNSYSIVTITAYGGAHPLAGITPNGTIVNSYSADTIPGGSGMANNSAQIINSFYDGNTLDGGAYFSDPGNPAEKTTVQLQTQTTYCPSGNCAGNTAYFDFATVWRIAAGAYPTLQIFNPTTATEVTYFGVPVPSPPPFTTTSSGSAPTLPAAAVVIAMLQPSTTALTTQATQLATQAVISTNSAMTTANPNTTRHHTHCMTSTQFQAAVGGFSPATAFVADNISEIVQQQTHSQSVQSNLDTCD